MLLSFGFRDRKSVIIDSLTEWATCSSHIVFTTFTTCDEVYNVTSFTCDVVWEVSKGDMLMCDFALDFIDFVDQWAVDAFSQVCTDAGF